MPVNEFIDLVGKGGVVALLIIVVWGFYAELWVSGATYRRALKERDEFRGELLTSMRVADRATRVTERTVDMAGSRLEAERRISARRRNYAEDDEPQE